MRALFLKRWAIRWVFGLALVYFLLKPRPAKTPHQYLEPPVGEEGTCTFKNCPPVMDTILNVHLIPHSHIDVGWRKTVDQYYTGHSENPEAELECTKCILNATIHQLLQDPSRRFIFMEMIYLKRFYAEASDSLKETIRQLIKERRLEITNGGWVMSDTGCTMYNDIIDQQTLGFDFIRETFGPCAATRTAWHVDQFGNSREHASIFAQMGYDALIVGRIDFQDLESRISRRSLEMIWSTSPKNFGAKGELFTHALYDGYYAPVNYVFGNVNYSVFEKGERSDAFQAFMEIIQERAAAFRTNHLIVPMGSDFGYTRPNNWFDNMDELIRLAKIQREKGGLQINIFYSTPSCYIHHMNQAKAFYETKEDDFQPYGTTPGVYWTGYFTTRGGLKMHVKKAGHILQSCKQLSILMDLGETYDKVNKLRDAMAILEHHDAITGTHQTHVLNDYNRLLSLGTKQCQTVMSMALQRLWSYPHIIHSFFCHSLNISSCPMSEGSVPFVMTLYNPMSWQVDMWVRLPVTLTKPVIQSGDNKEVQYQLLCVPKSIMKIPERSTRTDVEAVFKVTLPPMSTTGFYVKPEIGDVKPILRTVPRGKEVFIENKFIKLIFDSETGLLSEMVNKESSIELPLSQDFGYYGTTEEDDTNNSSSGAYVFFPFGKTVPVGEGKRVKNKIIKGTLVQEVHQTFSPWVSQIVRLYEGARHAEFQWVVGPIPIRRNSEGKEVVSQFTSNIQNEGKFYTDSNGREIMNRIRDYRETWKYEVMDNISGNYYPVTSRIFIQDKTRNIQLTILPDRSQGGSSLKDGCIELMVHRRLLIDDGFGLEDILNDVGIDDQGIIYTGKHYVMLDTIQNSTKRVKHFSLLLQFTPSILFTRFQESEPPSNVMTQHKFLTNPLPDNVQILTLDYLGGHAATNTYLLRLEHVFEVDDHPRLSKTATVVLEKLFEPFVIVMAEETTLGGNFHPDEVTRMEWNTWEGLTESKIGSNDYSKNMQPPFTIRLQPMEIRTFRIQVERS